MKEIGARRALVIALPYLVFALLFGVTWQRWIHPFQDCGREVWTATRLAAGEVLYRDVGYMYGPLPPVLDALALKAVRHVDALIALRLFVGLLGVEALRRLARRVSGDELSGSAIAAFVVATCAFAINGAWPFPYSGAALEGSVAVWWGLELALAAGTMPPLLVSGLLAGLAAGTKIEMLPVALLVPIAAWGRRPRRHVVLSSALAGLLAAAAWIVPIGLFGFQTVRRQGYLVALDNPEPWRRVQDLVMFGGQTRAEFLSDGWRDVLFPSLPFLLCSGFALAHVRGRRAVPLAFGLGLLGAALADASELHVLLVAAPAVVVVEAIRWLRRDGGDASAPVSLRIAGPALVALWRQPFFLRMGGYLFAAPLALLTSLGRLSRFVPAASTAAFLLGLSAAQVGDRWREYHDPRAAWEPLGLPGAHVRLPGAEAVLVREAVATLRERTPDGAWVGVIPEPGFLLFLAHRRQPFVDELFYAACQDRVAEDRMIRTLEQRPLAAFVELDRSAVEFGSMTPRHGVLDRFLAVVDQRLPVVVPIGTTGVVPRALIHRPIGGWVRLPAGSPASSATASTSPIATGIAAPRRRAGRAAASPRASGVSRG
jgi:hypothetical protein